MTAVESLTDVIQHWNDWQYWHDRYCDYVMGPLHRHVHPGDRDAIRVMDQDWDTLVVFDACRRDLFEDVVDVERFDEYNAVWSLGSNTGEWTVRNFCDSDEQTTFGDTVYVTGNISVSRRLSSDNFHAIENVWEENFDTDRGFVPPDPVRDAALRAHEEYPNKRIIVHVLQPHCPFVTRDADGGGYSKDVFDAPNEQKTGYVWWDLAQGNITADACRAAYAETLRVGWETMQPVLDQPDRRVIVTSDHGNMMGERPWPYLFPIYAHPTRTRPRQLVDVPWAVLEAVGDRPTIVDDGVGAGAQAIDESTLHTQLEALGYR